jgi:hypothetical protein
MSSVGLSSAAASEPLAMPASSLLDMVLLPLLLLLLLLLLLPSILLLLWLLICELLELLLLLLCCMLLPAWWSAIASLMGLYSPSRSPATAQHKTRHCKSTDARLQMQHAAAAMAQKP